MPHSPRPASARRAGYHRIGTESVEVVWLGVPRDTDHAPGWYWVCGWPGCLWDAEPVGPFATSDAALRHAQRDYDP